jgi:hypothetical protein
MITTTVSCPTVGADSRRDPQRMAWLLSQPHDRLALWLKRLANTLPQARHIIDLHRASQMRDLPTMRRLIHHIIFPNDKLTWRLDIGHVAQVDQVVLVIRSLSDLGYAPEVQGCCEEALDALDIAMQYLDQGVSEADSYEEILALHLEACRTCPPDPKTLADWLLRKRADCLTGIFDRVSKLYAELTHPGERCTVVEAQEPIQPFCTE